MGNWIDKVLFHLKSSEGLISRRSLESLLMNGASSYEQSLDRIRELLNKEYILRVDGDGHSFKLSQAGDIRITPYYESVVILMGILRQRLEFIFKDRHDIDLKGGITGLYFTYTKMSMFRFHPYKGKENEGLLIVRLPNLIGDTIDHKSNELYMSREILERTSLLEDVVKAHINMVDDYYSEEI